MSLEPSGLSNDHEFILIVGKSIQGDRRLGGNYDNPDDDPRGPWSSGNMVGMASQEARPNLHFDLIDPETGINYGCAGRGWRYGQDRMARLIEEKRILWPPEPNGRPREKVFLEDLGDHTNTSSVIELPVFTRLQTH